VDRGCSATAGYGSLAVAATSAFNKWWLAGYIICHLSLLRIAELQKLLSKVVPKIIKKADRDDIETYNQQRIRLFVSASFYPAIFLNSLLYIISQAGYDL
jgi:hypothetical protein